MGDWRGVVTTTKKTTAKPRERKAKAVTTSEAIKGFNHDMTCLGFQFEIGKEYSVPGKVVPCKNGFHACPVDTVDPMRVFGFYAPGQSRYCIVDQGGEIVPHGDDKAASGTIFIRKEISISEIIDRAVAYRLKSARATGETSNSGTRGAASNSGTPARRATAATTARRATAALRRGEQQRHYGAASNSGNYGAASNSGTRGAASNSGTTARRATAALRRGEQQRLLRRGEQQRRLRRGEQQRLLRRGEQQRRLRRGEQQRLLRRGEQQRLLRRGEQQRLLRRGFLPRLQQQGSVRGRWSGALHNRVRR
jgi:hypothetical protein